MRKTVSIILVMVFIVSALSPAMVTSGAVQGPTVEWRVKLPARSGLGEPTAPIVTDIDGDGIGEIILTSGDSLYILRAKGTTKWKYTVTGNVTGAAVADIDANTEKEIIAVTDTGAVHAFSRDGAHLWSYETKDSIHFAPMISDMNNDGRLEVVVMTANGGIFIIDNHGSMFSIKNAGASVGFPSSIASMYMAMDHQVFSFIYAVNVESRLNAVDYQGTLSWYGRTLPGLPTGGLAVGNIDNDTLPDVVVPTAGKVIASYGDDAHHTQWNGTFATNSPVLAPVLADINQDGNLEIIAGNSDGDIQQFSSSGTTGWMTHVEGGLAGLCAIRAPDVLFIAMTKTGHLVQIDAAGHQIWAKALGIVSDREPIVADIDADSEAEIIAVSTSGDVVLLNTHQVLKAGWTLTGHDLMNSRCLDSTLSGLSPWSLLWTKDDLLGEHAMVADVDGDGKDEFFSMNFAGYIMHLFRGNGREMVNQTLTAPTFIDPIGADINGDGAKEIILGTQADVQVRSGQLALIWSRQLNMTTAIAAADIDGDGKYEVFGGNETGHLLALTALDGVPLWSTDVGASIVSLTAADLMSDGIMDLIVTDAASIVSVLNATNGHLRWSGKVLTGTPTPPTVADLDGDGKLDLAVSSFGGDIMAYSGNGTELWERTAPTEPLGLITIDGNTTGQDLALIVNGTNDVLFLDGNTGTTLSIAKSDGVHLSIPKTIAAAYMGTADKVSIMSVFDRQMRWGGRSDGKLQSFIPGPDSQVMNIGDIDGDGILEAIFSGGFDNGYNLAYKLGVGPGTTIPWSMAGHDPERTYNPYAKNGRIYPDLTLGAQDISFDPLVLNGNVTVNVTMTYRNQGPMASAPFNITLYKDAAPIKTFKVSAMDPFSEATITYKWAGVSENSTFSADLDSGKTITELREDNNKVTRPIFKNQKPIAAAGPDVRTDPDKPVIFDAGASKDPDGDLVKYFWEFDDGTNATGVVTSHSFKNSGYYNVYLTVTDEYGATSRDNRTITVNHAPEFSNWNPKNSLTINEGELQDMWVITSDADGDKVSVTWFFDTKEVAQGQSWSYWANYSSSGAHKVLALASDGSLSTNKSWNLTVVDSTRLIQDTTPPTPVTIPEGQAQNFEVVLSQIAVGAVVTWYLDGIAILDGPKVLGIYATEGTQGQHTLKVQVQDDNTWDFYVWNVTIGPRQDIPTIRWVFPTNLLVETTYLTPIYFGISAQGGTYQWYVDGVVQVAQNGPSFRFDTWGNGSYNISVLVSSSMASVNRNWTLTVNYPPIASIDASPLILRPGKKVTLNADKSKAYKSGDAIVSYKWDFGDGSTDTGPLVKHAYKKAGGYKATVTVTDTRGLTSNATVTIVVEPKAAQASTPGFEGPLMIAALGVALVAVLRRKKK
jgi:outer membrane protein assembly factor BamB/PKD repeat protein